MTFIILLFLAGAAAIFGVVLLTSILVYGREDTYTPTYAPKITVSGFNIADTLPPAAPYVSPVSPASEFRSSRTETYFKPTPSATKQAGLVTKKPTARKTTSSAKKPASRASSSTSSSSSRSTSDDSYLYAAAAASSYDYGSSSYDSGSSSSCDSGGGYSGGCD